jgi:hypothetical protein
MLWLGYVLREVVKFSAFDSLQNYELKQLKPKIFYKECSELLLRGSRPNCNICNIQDECKEDTGAL